MRVVWLEDAAGDLVDLHGYVAEHNPPAAARLVTTIIAAVDSLARMPARGRPGRVAGTREFVIPRTPYLVAYRVRNETLEILRVLHGARQWPDQF